MTISIHPKVAEISFWSNDVYKAELIKRLNSKDAGRKRTLHQSTIEEINRFHREYELGSEQFIYRKIPTLTAGRITLCLAVLFLAGFVAKAWIPDPDMAETVAQERYAYEFFNPVPDGADYYPPED